MQPAKTPDKKGKKSGVKHVSVSSVEAGRRIDNYLVGLLKDIPKTRIYRMLRKGERTYVIFPPPNPYFPLYKPL